MLWRGVEKSEKIAKRLFWTVLEFIQLLLALHAKLLMNYSWNREITMSFRKFHWKNVKILLLGTFFLRHPQNFNVGVERGVDTFLRGAEEFWTVQENFSTLHFAPTLITNTHYTRTNTHTHIQMRTLPSSHTDTQAYTHTDTQTYTHRHANIYTHTHTHAHTHTRTHAHTNNIPKKY